MSSAHPHYDLNGLIQRLKLVENEEVIRQFHSLLDLIDSSGTPHTRSSSISPSDLMNRIDAAEHSIKNGTTISQKDFQQEVKQWLNAKKA